jgi:hypothetical protein
MDGAAQGASACLIASTFSPMADTSGLLQIHVHAAQLRHGDGPDRVVHRTQRSQRSAQLVCSTAIAGVVGIDITNDLPLTSSSTQTHQPTAPTKKNCKRSSFREAAEGFEPSTFCMASRTHGSPVSADIPCTKRGGSRV